MYSCRNSTSSKNCKDLSKRTSGSPLEVTHTKTEVRYEVPSCTSSTFSSLEPPLFVRRTHTIGGLRKIADADSLLITVTQLAVVKQLRKVLKRGSVGMSSRSVMCV